MILYLTFFSRNIFGIDVNNMRVRFSNLKVNAKLNSMQCNETGRLT